MGEEACIHLNRRYWTRDIVQQNLGEVVLVERFLIVEKGVDTFHGQVAQVVAPS